MRDRPAPRTSPFDEPFSTLLRDRRWRRLPLSRPRHLEDPRGSLASAPPRGRGDGLPAFRLCLRLRQRTRRRRGTEARPRFRELLPRRPLDHLETLEHLPPPRPRPGGLRTQPTRPRPRRLGPLPHPLSGDPRLRALRGALSTRLVFRSGRGRAVDETRAHPPRRHLGSDGGTRRRRPRQAHRGLQFRHGNVAGSPVLRGDPSPGSPGGDAPLSDAAETSALLSG